MRQSIIWRFVVIILVLTVWGASLFPLNDQPFYEVLKEEAGKKADKKLDRLIERAQKIDNSNDGKVLTPPRAVLQIAEKRGINLRDYISIYNQPDASNEAVVDLVRRKAAGKLRLGLDLRGGTEFIVNFDKQKLIEKSPSRADDIEGARDEIIEILRNRVDQSGVVEAQLQPIGPTTISLKIPSIDADDVKGFRELVQQTAQLDFRMVHEDNDALVAQEKNKDFKEPIAYERMLMKASEDASAPPQVLYVKRFPEKVNGQHISRAFPSVNQFGSYSISLEFDTEGAALFADTTRASVGQRMAIVLDNTVYSAPNINEAITGGRAEISGNFTPDEATKLSVVLRCGNLPVPIEVVGEFSTDPTLGADSVKSGAYSALAGLILIFIFMVVYYMTAGVIADLALLANILLVMGTMTIAGATVTLPGIAGIVLTIGMAVDANVLIFERIREELRNKKSIKNAVLTGYDRAFITIIDANITTLITALILYRFGSGSIRGFAVTLSIGIMASLFTALFMTRTIFEFLIEKDWIKKIKMVDWVGERNFDFLKVGTLTKMASIALIALSVATMLVRGKAAFSVDFTGGTAITYNYVHEVPISDVRAALDKAGYTDARVSYKSSAQQETKLLEIVVASVEENDQDEASDAVVASVPEVDVKNEIQQMLNATFPDAEFAKGSKKEIGGLVGARFTKQALAAFGFSLLGIIAYITFRFEFAFAIGAVAALAHDIIICTGIFLIANFGERQLSLPVIAALLTIMGYSLNDTIVIFDRIRENVGLIKKKDYLEIVNLSLNSTISRTLLTSVTTMIVVVTLYIFGGGAINDFALVMLVGVLVGTYSSLFVATPVMIFWRNRSGGRQENQAATKTAKLAETTA